MKDCFLLISHLQGGLHHFFCLVITGNHYLRAWTFYALAWLLFLTYSKEVNFWSFLSVDRVWRSSKVDSSIVRPTYGHSSVLHPGTGRIYVHGGYRMLNSSCYRASSETFYYESKAGKWYQLRNIGIPRFLHSAVIIDSAMIIFGGRGEKELVSRHLMVFDISECPPWLSRFFQWYFSVYPACMFQFWVPSLFSSFCHHGKFSFDKIPMDLAAHNTLWEPLRFVLMDFCCFFFQFSLKVMLWL